MLDGQRLVAIYLTLLSIVLTRHAGAVFRSFRTVVVYHVRM